MDNIKRRRKNETDIAKEPIFCVYLPSQMRPLHLAEDYFHYISENNSKLKKAETDFKETCCGPTLVAFIFKLSSHFKQENEVTFLTVEIFDRFLLNHVMDLRPHVKGELSYEWDVVEKRVTDQLVLRVCTSLLLASKMVSRCKDLTGKILQQWLETHGYYYTLSNLMNSEVRVMKTLDYRINILTPLSYVETLLEVLTRRTTEIRPKELYDSAVLCIKLFYLNRKRIFDDLFEKAVGNDNQHLESIITPPQTLTNQAAAEFQKVRCDYMFIAAGILVIAAGFESATLQRNVGHKIAEITCFTVTDIEDLCGVLIKYIVKHCIYK